ncbi:MAG: 30S ribosomal protein S6 [Clostridiales bacterium]|nr:30S ribosomal protein S6 [Clostridia bacterium]MCR5353260.1 30S ribosomal protein S6 [Clostridiales bacterium]
MELTSKYETVFIVNPEFTEEAAKEMLDKFTGIISENGGTVDKVDEWGKKKLAYLIDDYADGYYYVVEFTSGAELPSELDRIFNITDGILRSIIVKIEK